jgi:hypothetical protein
MSAKAFWKDGIWLVLVNPLMIRIVPSRLAPSTTRVQSACQSVDRDTGVGADAGAAGTQPPKASAAMSPVHASAVRLAHSTADPPLSDAKKIRGS